MTTATQTRRPWRATVRTIVQMGLGIAFMAPLIYTAITQGQPEQATGWAATALGISAAITRVMALPAVEAFLRRWPWLSWLAAEPESDPAIRRRLEP